MILFLAIFKHLYCQTVRARARVCQVSCVIFSNLFVLKKSNKEEKLVGAGSVIFGATPSLLFTKTFPDKKKHIVPDIFPTIGITVMGWNRGTKPR